MKIKTDSVIGRPFRTEAADGGDQSIRVDHRGPHLPRQIADLCVELLHFSTNYLDLAYQVRSLGLFIAKPGQSKTEGRHFLPYMVVQVAGEPLAFSLLGLRNPLKGLILSQRIEGVYR